MKETALRMSTMRPLVIFKTATEKMGKMGEN
jgi:hypothetical protein